MVKSTDRTSEGMDKLIDLTRAAVVSLADRTERGVESAAEVVAERTHAAGEYVREGARATSRSAHRNLDQGYSRARCDLSRAATATIGYATEHLGMALVLAAAAGFVLGLSIHLCWRSD